MQTVKLTQTIGWRGVTYAPGDRQIPDELAIVLGMEAKADSSKSVTVTDLDESTEPSKEQPKIQPKAKRKGTSVNG
jgi:hypothetical protein